jgi:hypothetical protein
MIQPAAICRYIYELIYLCVIIGDIHISTHALLSSFLSPLSLSSLLSTLNLSTSLNPHEPHICKQKEDDPKALLSTTITQTPTRWFVCLFVCCWMTLLIVVYKVGPRGWIWRVARVAFKGTSIMRRPRGYGKAFMKSIDSRIGLALMEEHKDMGEKEVEIFGRKWEVCI